MADLGIWEMLSFDTYRNCELINLTLQEEVAMKQTKNTENNNNLYANTTKMGNSLSLKEQFSEDHLTV